MLAVENTEIALRFRVLRIQGNCGLELSFCIAGLPRLQIQKPKLVMSRSQVRIQRNRFYQSIFLCRIILLPVQRKREVVVRVSVLRIFNQRLPIEINCLLGVAGLQVLVSLVGLRSRDILLNTLLFLLLKNLELLLSLILLPQPPQHTRQLKSRFARIGVKPHCLFQLLSRLRPLAQFREYETEVVANIVVIRTQHHGALEQRFGLGIVSHSAINHTRQIECVKAIRLAVRVILDHR